MDSVSVEENKKNYLLKMKTSDSTETLANLLAAGVSWPGYQEAGEDVRVSGYSMARPIVEITISRVGLWTTEDTVRKVVSGWGEVKDLFQEHLKGELFSHIKTDVWKVKIIKNKDVQIPGIVSRLGSERHGEEREMWKVWYRGVPQVCYSCFQEGHVLRDCKARPVTLATLASQPGIGEEAVATGEGSQGPRTFAQVH